MADQSAVEQKPFLQRVIDRCELTSTNDAQVASKVVFRLLRDMMPTQEVQKVEAELKESAQDTKNVNVGDLWGDPNVMVAFFSRVSPLRQLGINYGTFMLRLKQEGALPEGIAPENVTQAVFSATKEDLPVERVSEISRFISDDQIRQMWEQA
ncbi:MAG: DUF2267 domain-containing protein [Synechococcales bacterium]|nr:DUF2267 domain-containing protein [Synechococcales bacterium]